MKTFVAYRSTGEDPAALAALLMTVKQAFAFRNIDAYCSHFFKQEFEQKDYSKREALLHAYSVIESSGFLFVLLASSEKSEGMLLEIGYAMAKDKPIVLAVREGVEGTMLPHLLVHSFVWSDELDLARKIRSFSLPHA